MHVFQCSNVIFIRSFGTCFDAPVHLCKLNTCCPVTPAYGPEQAFGRGIQRNSRCISCLFSVIWMWWCVGSRAAANTYLPEGSSELACLIAVCCLLWSAWFGVNAMSRRDWEKVIKSNVFFLRVLTPEFSINSLGPHTCGWFSKGEFLWGIMTGSKFKPDLSAYYWVLQIDCHLASAQGSI